MKIFEANSVLDWFQSNWDAFQGEYSCEEKILGIHVYGFPIDDDELEEGQKVPAPKTISELKSKIEEHVYLNEIKTHINCVQVHTDDDEIELAWYVFDEVYAEKYPEKVAIWMNEYLPQTYGEVGQLLDGKFKNILPQGSDKGCVYYGSAAIYDSGNLESLEGLHKIENVRLPSFLNYLRNHKISFKNKSDSSYGLDELLLFQFVAKQLPNADFKDIIDILGRIPTTEFGEVDIKNIDKYTLDDVLKIELAEPELPQSSFMNISEHLCEWNTVIRIPMGDELEDLFKNYFVLFDDLWVEKNELLAKNLARFTKTWAL